ncbi:kinesin-like protein NACK1 isoform X2 [Strongylocentrotus purpuratus]|uniref:Kinesin motor domain-containing protein n=1 Tax=Strongylocentrotus purpuratus TaxID=7668 RepID=A0A7M7N914_STRPU|nr:kinesin-like protein NACK1 isoform X2 [Strongylocentrotus purpuratus]
MASGGSLFEMCLKEAQLDHYSSSFQGGGIGDLETLATLSMQEYNSYGVTSSQDKKQLFRLIHTLRNLDLNKVSDLNGPDQQVTSIESSTPYTMSHKEKSSHHGNKKAVKNHHNNMASLSGRNAEMVQSGEKLNNIHNDHHITKLGDMPRNSVLNRTFDKDDESDRDINDRSVTMETIYNEPEKNLNNGVNDSQVLVLEHSNSGYNYGVPSASPTTQYKLKSGMKSATVSTPHSRNGVTADEKIKVCVRKRPMNQKEWRAGEGDAVSIEGSNTALVKERKLTVDLTKIVQVHKYHFDEVFHETCSNEEVYERTAKPLVQIIFNRGKATCFAYGQTGAGKTHTLLGGQGGKVKGLYLLAAEDIFTIIRSSADGHGLAVYVSYFEIYCGQLCDLLNNRERLHARENAHHKVCISGLNEIKVSGPQALMQIVETGNRLRVVGASGVNADSSRSHAILQIQLKDKAGNQIGKFSFVDLAGSERACDMNDPDKVTRQEGAEINTSLLALKECIRALDQEKRHTPFRQSKLTQVLRDSFLGQSRTCMIACVAPNASAVDHTLNTLRYADRVKELKQEGGLGNSPAADSSITIATKHPPTPSNFSPGSTSTPQKTKRSKQEKSSALKGSPKKKGDLSQRKNSTVTPSKSTGKSRMETRRKSAPDTSPTKTPTHAESSSKFAGKKSASQHNLQKSLMMSGQSKAEKRNRGDVAVVQKLKYEQVSNASGSKSVEKRIVIQSGVKVRENRTLEERKIRASANRSRYEDMNLSLGNETPSKRTPEVRARMKKAFLNSSLPVWDLNQQETEVPSPSKLTPTPQKLEFENPRYVESPSKEKPKNDDQRTWAQKVADEGKVNIPYRFDVPNPRYSLQQGSPEDIESGYLPDMDSEIETPRNHSGHQSNGDITSNGQEQDYRSDKKSSIGDCIVYDSQNETTSSLQLEEVQEVRVSSKSNAYSEENGRRTRTPSSESRPSSRSDDTVELLAEIERSLQRSPVPVTPKPGSEPWMRVISEDKFHGSEVFPAESPRRQTADGSSISARKELFGAGNGEPEGLSEESPMKRKVKQTQDVRCSVDATGARVGSGVTDSSDNQRSFHVFKEKLHHSGFSQRELLRDALSPQILQETRSENLQMHNRSKSNVKDVRVQSLQTGYPQTRSAWAEGSVDGSRPVVQQGKQSSSQEQFFSALSHIPVSPYDSQSTNYATPAESRLGQQPTAVSSTPKAFKHESLDSSLLHLSFSTIQSPGKGSQNPSSETNESFTPAREAVIGQENKGNECEEVALPVSPRLTLTKSKSDGSLMTMSVNRQSCNGKPDGTSPTLKPPQRPEYQRQNSAAERASHSSTAHPNNHNSTRDLLLAAHAEQLEETLRLCETGWSLIAQLRSNQMDVQSYMSEAGDLLDSHVWCLDTFRDQLNSFSRCSTPNK